MLVCPSPSHHFADLSLWFPAFLCVRTCEQWARREDRFWNNATHVKEWNNGLLYIIDYWERERICYLKMLTIYEVRWNGCLGKKNHLPNLLFVGVFLDKPDFFYRKWICNCKWICLTFYYFRWIHTMLHLVVKDVFDIPSTWLHKILHYTLLKSDVEKIILCLVIFSWLSNKHET